MGRFQIISYGVDLEKLDQMIAATMTLAGDLNLHRRAEREAEKLISLERRLTWRIRHLQAYVFTQREIEAMEHEQFAMAATQFGPQRVKADQVLSYVAGCMRVKPRHAKNLLDSAEELMYYHATANPDYVGWQLVGKKWRLVVPTGREAVATLSLVKSAAAILRKVA